MTPTDCQFLLDVLSDGRPHTLTEILRRSFQERGCGLTVHSRVADLRKQGYTIENERVSGATRGNASAYRLIIRTLHDIEPISVGPVRYGYEALRLDMPRSTYEEA